MTQIVEVDMNNVFVQIYKPKCANYHYRIQALKEYTLEHRCIFKIKWDISIRKYGH